MDALVQEWCTLEEQLSLPPDALQQIAEFRSELPVIIDTVEDDVKPITAAGRIAANRSRREQALADLPTEFTFPGVVQFVTTGPSTNAAGEESGQTEWSGLLAPIGEPTDDGRILDPAEAGAITWRELPLTLMAQFATAMGHDGAVIAGRIDTIAEGPASFAGWSGQGFNATGVFDDAPGEAGSDDGRKAARLSRDGMLRGVSVDLAADEVELRTKDNEPIPEDDEEAWLEAIFGGGLMAVTWGSLLGATMTPFPAFAEANVEAAPVVVASLSQIAALQWAEPRELEVVLAAGAVRPPQIDLDRAQAYALLEEKGIASSDEVREWLGLEPAKGGNVLRAPAASVASIGRPTGLRKLRVIRDDRGVAQGYEEVPS